MRGHVAGDQTLNVLLKIVMGLAFKPCLTPVLSHSSALLHDSIQIFAYKHILNLSVSNFQRDFLL